MSWIVEYLDKAKDDLRGLEGSQRKQVLKAIQKVSQNTLPDVTSHEVVAIVEVFSNWMR